MWLFVPSSLALALLLIGAVSASAQESRWTELPQIPNRLEVVKDSQGFFWQLTGAGSFYTMGANTFKSANQLVINGANFAADKGWKLNETRYAFERDWEEIHVRRDIWIDPDRSGARHVEMIRNKNKTDVLRLPVEISSNFSYPFEQMLSAEGMALEQTSKIGTVLRFDPVNGQSDFFYLFGGANEALRPTIRSGEGNRQFALRYDLVIQPEETVALVYWCGQRSTAEAIPEIFVPFYQRQSLVRASLPAEVEVQEIRNFSEASLAAASTQVMNDSKSLLGLNRFLHQLNAERTGMDLLWMSEEKRLAGVLSPEQTIEVTSIAGKLTLQASEIAALRGGGTHGRLHEVFLRDGNVLIGNAELGEAEMLGDDGRTMQLNAERLDVLLTKVGKPDGRRGEGVRGFVELISGDILAIKSSETPNEVRFSTPWGTGLIPLSQINAMGAVSMPTPRFRVVLADGSELTGFLLHGTEFVTLATARFGPIEINPSQIQRFWLAGATDLEIAETEFEPNKAPNAVSTIWLEGGNRMAGALTSETLHLVAGTKVTPFQSSDVVLMSRTEESILDRTPIFKIELSNGDQLHGRLRERSLKVQALGKEWRIPSLHCLGYHGAK